MAQNVTVAGASYSDVPAVTLPKTGGGTARFTDVTDTTAIASDVASGKYFHLATGERVVGTASGGGGNAYTLTEVAPLQTFTAAPAGGGYQAELTHSGVLEEGEPYLITLDNDVYVLDCGVLWGSEYIVGTPSALWNSGGSGDATIPFAVDWDTSVMVVAVYDLNQHAIKIEHLEFVDGPLDLQAKTATPTTSQQVIQPDSGYDGLSQVTVGAIPSQYIVPSGSQTITSNNTYDVTALAEVVVNVTGSSAQTATGTFTGNGTRTIDVSCTFEPDLVYVTSDPGTTASSGTVALIIARDMMAATRYRNNSTTNSHYAMVDIVNMNTSGSSYSWRATYANSTVTLYCFSNNARSVLTSGRTYTYKFVKWT